MGISSYLPSPQFSLILSSALFAGALIWAADYYTSPPKPSEIVSAPSPSAFTVEGLDWQAALSAIQGEDTLPPPPSEAVVASLLSASETPNITATVGRSILINLGEAKAQGLGSDTPTQERILESAISKIQPSLGVKAYTTADLLTVPSNQQTLTAYGNGVASILGRYPNASVEATLVAVASATDTGKASELTPLKGIGSAYSALLTELAALPVPNTLAPLHLQVVNNFSRIAGSYADMDKVLTDPLRGLAGLQSFRTLTQETERLFINIAQTLDRNGILFSENEPGYAWSLLVAP